MSHLKHLQNLKGKTIVDAKLFDEFGEPYNPEDTYFDMNKIELFLSDGSKVTIEGCGGPEYVGLRLS